MKRSTVVEPAQENKSLESIVVSSKNFLRLDVATE